MTGHVSKCVCMHVCECVYLTHNTLFWLFKPNLLGLIPFAFVYLSSSFVYGGFMAWGRGVREAKDKERLMRQWKRRWRRRRRGRQVQRTPGAITGARQKRGQEIKVVLATWHYRLSAAVSELTSESRWRWWCVGFQKRKRGGGDAGGNSRSRWGEEGKVISLCLPTTLVLSIHLSMLFWISSRFMNAQYFSSPSHFHGRGLLRTLQAFSTPVSLRLLLPPFVLPASVSIYGSMRAQFSQCFQAISSHCAVWFKDPVAHMKSLLSCLYRASRLCANPCVAHSDFAIIVQWGSVMLHKPGAEWINTHYWLVRRSIFGWYCTQLVYLDGQMSLSHWLSRSLSFSLSFFLYL